MRRTPGNPEQVASPASSFEVRGEKRCVLCVKRCKSYVVKEDWLFSLTRWLSLSIIRPGHAGMVLVRKYMSDIESGGALSKYNYSARELHHNISECFLRREAHENKNYLAVGGRI